MTNTQDASPLERIEAKYKVAYEPLTIDGTTFDILTIANMCQYLDELANSGKLENPLKDLPLWAKVWPAALVLGRFLRKYDPQNKTMLELGAGVGVCSLIASRYGFARITITDINEDALDFARVNIQKNHLPENITVRQLDVRQTGLTLPEKQDFICASELLYLEELHRPLLKFVKRNLSPDGKAFFCVDLNRQNKRFEKLAASDFHIQSGCIGVKSVDEEGEKRSIYKIIILENK